MNEFNLADSLRAWEESLLKSGSFKRSDLAELEDHVHTEMESLAAVGLSDEESFLVAVRRIGATKSLSSEFQKVNGAFVWKQLAVDDGGAARGAIARHIAIVVLLAAAAALAAHIPEWFGIDPWSKLRALQVRYLRNLGLFVAPAIAGYFMVTRPDARRAGAALLVLTGVLALAVNLLPLKGSYQTGVLTALHLPVALFVGIGIVYAGSRRREPEALFGFIRYLGEAFIYTVLLLLGGGVLVVLALLVFQAIGVDVHLALQSVVATSGAAAAPVVAVYLVDAKKSIIENIAPVLARIFSPLFLALILVYLVVMAARGSSPYDDRNFLLVFNVMLLVVLALAVYAISAREPGAKVGAQDWITLALLFGTIAVDLVALSAIIVRLNEFGVSANRLAVLGDNVLVLGNLAALAVTLVRFITVKRDFSPVVRAQARYLWAYAIWSLVVALAFPPMFGFA